MGVVTFIAEMGTMADGSRINIEGLQFPNRVPLTVNFDKTNTIGEAEVWVEDGVLKARADVKEDFKGLYPAVGVQIIKQSVENGVRHLLETKLHQISLNHSPNADKNIQPIL